MSENLEQLQKLTQQPSPSPVSGFIRRAHMEVTDNRRAFYLCAASDGIQVESGFQGDNPNFVVPLQSENIRNLISFFADDSIGEYEQYRIVKLCWCHACAQRWRCHSAKQRVS
jgi:hypothetical protein